MNRVKRRQQQQQQQQQQLIASNDNGKIGTLIDFYLCKLLSEQVSKC